LPLPRDLLSLIFISVSELDIIVIGRLDFSAPKLDFSAVPRLDFISVSELENPVK